MQWGTPQLWLEGDLGLNGASATDKLGDLELLLSLSCRDFVSLLVKQGYSACHTGY